MCLSVNKIVASLVSGLTSRLKRLKRRNEPGQPWVTAWGDQSHPTFLAWHFLAQTRSLGVL